MTGTELQQEKLAADGTRRGLTGTRKGTKNRATLLLEQMQRAVKEKYDVDNFDPVVMLAIVGMECLEPTYRKHPETGDEILCPPDRGLAISAFGKAAPYVRSTLRAVELSGPDDGPIMVEAVGAKEKLASMIGFVLDDDEDTDTDDA